MMTTLNTGNLPGSIRPILAAIHTLPIPVPPGQQAEPRPTAPFVTISRQAGASGRSLAQRLVERLNDLDPGDRPWTSWDRELVEKVAADHGIRKALVESLEDAGHTWMQEFLSGLNFGTGGAYATELEVYRHVATTIRALARVGRVVIVGRGGVCLTRDMLGGVHVRLVAPLQHRAQHMAQLLGVPHAQAAVEVRQLDHNRQGFYRRYWPKETLSPETFTMVLNAATMDEDQVASCILPLLARSRVSG